MLSVSDLLCTWAVYCFSYFSSFSGSYKHIRIEDERNLVIMFYILLIFFVRAPSGLNNELFIMFSLENKVLCCLVDLLLWVWILVWGVVNGLSKNNWTFCKILDMKFYWAYGLKKKVFYGRTISLRVLIHFSLKAGKSLRLWEKILKVTICHPNNCWCLCNLHK